MDTTAVIDLQPATRTQSRAHGHHALHEPDENHSNKVIDSDDTELNETVHFGDEKQLLDEQYSDYLNSRNEKLSADLEAGKISKEQYQKRHQTVAEFLRGSNGSKEKSCMTDAVFTIGDEATQCEILDTLGFKYSMIPTREKGTLRPHLTDPAEREQWKKLWLETYGTTVRDISNYSNGALKVTTMTTNLDEATAHAHAGFVNGGHSANGKPSTTLNAALKQMYGGSDSRVNMKKFRDTCDKAMVFRFNKTAQGMGLNIHLDMVRLGSAGGKTMAEYKASKADAKKNEDDAKKNQQDAERNRQLQQQLSQERQAFDDEKAKFEAEQKEQMKRLKMREREAAEAVTSVIEMYNPDHFVHGHDINREDAQPISTETGMQQHLAQPLKYLVGVMQNSVRNFNKRLTQIRRNVRENIDIAKADRDLMKLEKATRKQNDDGLDK